MAIMREGTNLVLDWKPQMSGVPITPGAINDIALSKREAAATIALGKMMDYELTFLPKNPIPDGAMIKLQFPTSFTFPYDNAAASPPTFTGHQ